MSGWQRYILSDWGERVLEKETRLWCVWSDD